MLAVADAEEFCHSRFLIFESYHNGLLLQQSELIARFEAMKVLPSPVVVEVHDEYLFLVVTCQLQLVRNPLKISDIRLLLFSCITMLPLLPLALAVGMSPMIGS